MGLVTEYSNELASSRHVKSNKASLSLAVQSAKEVATLGASLLMCGRSRDVKQNNDSVGSYILEGYAMAYLLILSGSIIWGVGTKLPSGTFNRRKRTIEVHLDFLAEVMEKKISLSCNPITWKTYICCFVGLMGSRSEGGLSRWNEHELALMIEFMKTK